MSERIKLYYISKQELTAFQIHIARKLNESFGEEYQKYKEHQQTQGEFDLTDIIKSCATGAVWDFLFQEGNKQITLPMANSLKVIFQFEFGNTRLEQIVKDQLAEKIAVVCLNIR